MTFPKRVAIVVCVLFCLLLLFQAGNRWIRPHLEEATIAPPSDRLSAEYRQDAEEWFASLILSKVSNIRFVAEVDGDVRLGTGRFTFDLYRVSPDSMLNILRVHCSAGSRSSRPGAAHWQWQQVSLVLAESDTSSVGVPVTLMGGFGARRRGFDCPEPESVDAPAISLKFKETLQGKCSAGSTVLIYVEGDREFAASREMTLDDFRAVNKGNFNLVFLTYKP